eukprot:gb/GEZN01009958.1/.p1 GENE.gb/GEZN01009958.1/~~gb/GEZN01009958.1/.p1  ORF type:complete len:321 (+),score=31.48 gb/GEZN01009958.1/:42-1004(+)
MTDASPHTHEHDVAELGQMKPLANMTLGIVSGCMAESIAYPLFVWKNNAQQGLKTVFHPRIIYQGLPMAMINLGGTTGVQFWATGFFQRILMKRRETLDPHGDHKRISPEDQMTAALFAGVLSGVPNSVWELLIVQQQRFGGGTWETPKTLVRRFGYTSLLRGSICTLGREGVGNLAMLGMTPVLAHWLIQHRNMGEHTALATGSLASSIFSCALSHPLDTIKTCMQGDMEQQKYKGIRQTWAAIVQEHGFVGGLFKGFAHRVALVALSFYLINSFKDLLTPHAQSIFSYVSLAELTAVVSEGDQAETSTAKTSIAKQIR